MKRTNQFERTTRDIVNAFLEVLEHKSFEKIVVQDILNTAMINRSTFYQHFSDKYAILDYLQEKYFSEFSNLVTPLREQHGLQNFSQMDAYLRDYFKENAATLRLLLPIKTEHIDFYERFRSIYSDYFHQILPSLSPMELRMLSGMILDYFTYSLTSDNLAATYTSSFFECSLNLTLALFSLDQFPEARNDLRKLIGKYQPD